MLENITLNDIVKLLNSLSVRQGNSHNESSDEFKVWQIGNIYFIRTVTMHLIGRVSIVNDKELVLEKAAWVADSGRFYDALKTGTLNEIEPFVNSVIVNRSAIVDATIWNFSVPTEQK